MHRFCSLEADLHTYRQDRYDLVQRRDHQRSRGFIRDVD
jgi:hypothetical protein